MVKKQNTLDLITGRKPSLELKFHYFANGKFAKLQSYISSDFYKSLNDSLLIYNRNSEIKIR